MHFLVRMASTASDSREVSVSGIEERERNRRGKRERKSSLYNKFLGFTGEISRAAEAGAHRLARRVREVQLLREAARSRHRTGLFLSSTYSTSLY